MTAPAAGSSWPCEEATERSLPPLNRSCRKLTTYWSFLCARSNDAVLNEPASNDPRSLKDRERRVGHLASTAGLIAVSIGNELDAGAGASHEDLGFREVGTSKLDEKVR